MNELSRLIGVFFDSYTRGVAVFKATKGHDKPQYRCQFSGRPLAAMQLSKVIWFPVGLR